MNCESKRIMSVNKKHSDQDYECLYSYFKLAETVADLIGSHCEVVIHSLENLEKSVVKIVNGHHTGRTVNSPMTDLGLKMLRTYELTGEEFSKSYFTKNKNDGWMKSTTCFLKNHNNEVIGMFCVNINLSLPFPEIIATLMPESLALTSLAQNQQESFSAHAKDVIDKAIVHAEKEVDGMTHVSLKTKNKEIIRCLYDNGIFELKEATVVVAKYLGITRHAVYKNIREFKSI